MIVTDFGDDVQAYHDQFKQLNFPRPSVCLYCQVVGRMIGHGFYPRKALGQIPKGWKIATVGEVVEFAYGKALKEDIRQPGPIPVYGSNGQVGWHDVTLAKGPGIVIGRKGNPGTVTWAATDFFPIDTTFYVVPKAPYSLHYLFYALERLDLPSLSADSAVPGLNRNMAYMTDMLIPSTEVVTVFEKLIAPLLIRVHANDEESRTLAALRDMLLPKLLSGEVRVKA